MESLNTPLFLTFLQEVAICFGVGAFENEEKVASETEGAVGNIEFSSEDGKIMQLQIEEEISFSSPALSVRVVFGLRPEEKEWSCQRNFLEAFLRCRLLPGTLIPLAPSILPDESLELRCLLPLDEQAKGHLISLVSFASTFYQETDEGVRELGFTEQLTMKLQSLDRASETLWNLGVWSRNKASASSVVAETYSSERHYYRLLSATETAPGILAINLGNAADVMKFEEIFSMLLNINAATFFSDHYYVGIDEFQGLLLLALLPPAKKEQGDILVAQLLQRAVAVRRFLIKLTKDLEAASMKEAFQNIPDMEELFLS